MNKLLIKHLNKNRTIVSEDSSNFAKDLAKYYNAKKGDMFKITRNGKNGESIIYRCVV